MSTPPTPETVDPPPTPGLRERKKAATMHHIQETALALFTTHGFDQVTIEQVAAASDVSPSTVYRYFGTKEGLVIHDEYDDRVALGLTHFLEQGLSPWQAMTAAIGLVEEDHFVLEEESTRTRIRLWFDTPSVQARAYLAVDETVDQIATLMAETGRWDFPRARIVTSAMIWPLLATLKNWHEAGAHGSAAELLRDAVATLRDAAMEGTP